LRRGAVTRLRVSKPKIAAGGGILRVQGNDLLELHDGLGELAALRQVITNLVNCGFKIRIDRRAFLELR